MIKTKTVVIVVGVVVLAGSVSGGAFLKFRTKPDVNTTSDSTSQQSSGSVAGEFSAASTSTTIPLNQATETPEAGGLSVTSNTSSNSAIQAAGTQGGVGQTGSQAASGSGQSSQTNPFDPTTYAQYDKYLKDTSGLFADAQMGTGTALTASHKAVVLYRGWLTNGKVFDESRKGSDGKYAPFTFTLGSHEVITGWEQALAGMKVGGVRLVIVPPSVGYGATAQNGIPANSVLVFQVQLVDVQ